MNVLIFGGTTEGRIIAAILKDNGFTVTLIVATDYGKDAAHGFDAVYAKRLSAAEMEERITSENYNVVIDATHPYATEATKNIRAACERAKAEYVRLIRDKSEEADGCIYVENAGKAAEFLNNTNGNVLIAAGSKSLSDFTSVINYKERLFVRVIPMEESLKNAVSLGYKSSNIICMQGPFSVDLNAAMIKMINASYIVTKDSGVTGGFHEKLAAASVTGAKAIVIKRPEEKGLSFAQVLRKFNIADSFYVNDSITGHADSGVSEFPFFPLFVNMRGKKVVIAGGGKIATRRAVKLAHSGAAVTVISPNVKSELSEYIQSGKINHINRKYENGDTLGAFLVIAATNDNGANESIMNEAKKSNILVIVASDSKKCDCYFPAIAENGEYMAGVVSKNGNHSGLKQFTKHMRRFF